MHVFRLSSFESDACGAEPAAFNRQNLKDQRLERTKGIQAASQFVYFCQIPGILRTLFIIQIFILTLRYSPLRRVSSGRISPASGK